MSTALLRLFFVFPSLFSLPSLPLRCSSTSVSPSCSSSYFASFAFSLLFLLLLLLFLSSLSPPHAGIRCLHSAQILCGDLRQHFVIGIAVSMSRRCRMPYCPRAQDFKPEVLACNIHSNHNNTNHAKICCHCNHHCGLFSTAKLILSMATPTHGKTNSQPGNTNPRQKQLSRYMCR